jgi:uncharacterized protein (DUF779 family)
LPLIEKLKAEFGPLIFHQSGGCCDGSSPMCYPENESKVGRMFYWVRSAVFRWARRSLSIGSISNSPMTKFRVVGGMFSLEGPEGLRLSTRSRLYPDEEWATLEKHDVAPSPELCVSDSSCDFSGLDCIYCKWQYGLRSAVSCAYRQDWRFHINAWLSGAVLGVRCSSLRSTAAVLAIGPGRGLLRVIAVTHRGNHRGRPRFAEKGYGFGY